MYIGLSLQSCWIHIYLFVCCRLEASRMFGSVSSMETLAPFLLPSPSPLPSTHSLRSLVPRHNLHQARPFNRFKVSTYLSTSSSYTLFLTFPLHFLFHLTVPRHFPYTLSFTYPTHPLSLSLSLPLTLLLPLTFPLPLFPPLPPQFLFHFILSFHFSYFIYSSKSTYLSPSIFLTTYPTRCLSLILLFHLNFPYAYPSRSTYPYLTFTITRDLDECILM